MARASTNVTYAVRDETTPGTKATGTYEEIPLTGDSVSPNHGEVASQTIRSDRQTVDSIRTFEEAGGALNFELMTDASGSGSEKGLSYLWPKAIGASSFSGGGTTYDSTAVTIDAVNDQIDMTTPTGTPTAGQFVRISGSTNHDGIVRAVAFSTPSIDVAEDLSDLGVDETDAITIASVDTIAQGTDKGEFTLVRQYDDLSNIEAFYTGCVLDGFTLRGDSQSVVTGTFPLLGRREQTNTSTGVTTAAYNRNQVFNGVTHLVACWEGFDGTKGSASALTLTGFDLNVTNNNRALREMGTLGAADINHGGIGITGSVQAYFADANNAFYDKALDGTETNLFFVFKNDDGDMFAVELPAVRLNNPQRVAGGRDSDIIMQANFTGFLASLTNFQNSIRIASYTA